MFAVLFEVQPKTEQWDAYLGYAKALRPDLETMPGFVENIRYASLTRPGWVLSLSTWADEAALARWRSHEHHHAIQEKGRAQVFRDYRLHVGEIVETPAAITLIDAKRPPAWAKATAPESIAASLSLPASGLVGWDIFDAVLTPGDVILMLTWRDQDAAEAFKPALPVGARLRHVRVVRDYGMFDRREAPQHFPDVSGKR